MDMPTLSVITVCFRAKEALSATVDSLLQQTWTDFEYLVIDGGSDDGTVPFLGQLEPLFSAKQIPFFCSSEPDHGIYDAMNKGVKKAPVSYTHPTLPTILRV